MLSDQPANLLSHTLLLMADSTVVN